MTPSSRGTSRTAPDLQRAVEADRTEEVLPEFGDDYAWSDRNPVAHYEVPIQGGLRYGRFCSSSVDLGGFGNAVRLHDSGRLRPLEGLPEPICFLHKGGISQDAFSSLCGIESDFG